MPLKGAYNVRELGGYPAEGKKVTKFKRFLRSDDLSQLTKEDITFLLDYGVTSVIDLRSAYEIEHSLNPFVERDEINYFHAPLLKMNEEMLNSFDQFIDTSAIKEEGLLVHMYLDILKNSKDMIYEIFHFMAKQKGCILFHCTAGKDRTGIIAMLLLGLAQVSRADIIANYMITEEYNAENPNQRMMDAPIELPEELLWSKPEYMKEAYDFIMEKDGSITDYLFSTGINENTFKKLKNRILT